MQWNSSYAQSYVNSTLCGSTESGYDVTSGTSWGSTDSSGAVDLSTSSSESSEEAVTSVRNSDSLLVGAWRGAADGVGVDQLGGYFTGFLDNLEVSWSRNGKTFLPSTLQGGVLFAAHLVTSKLEMAILSSAQLADLKWQTSHPHHLQHATKHSSAFLVSPALPEVILRPFVHVFLNTT